MGILREKLAVVRQNARNWPWVYHQAVKRAAYASYRAGRNDGIRVCDEQWDTLIILDACRFDAFAAHLEESPLSGRLESRISRGGATPEFVEENFADRSFPNTVYVTANPFVYVRLDDPFYETINLWQTAWDDEANTVLPETVVDATVEARERHPDKRLIAHFMQPHTPFLGSPRRSGAVWEIALREGVDVARAAYLSNLKYVFPHVETLVDELTGRTVVTGDHGNAFGERVPPFGLPFYGHASGVYLRELVTVPWFVVDHDSQ